MSACQTSRNDVAEYQARAYEIENYKRLIVKHGRDGRWKLTAGVYIARFNGEYFISKFVSMRVTISAILIVFAPFKCCLRMPMQLMFALFLDVFRSLLMSFCVAAVGSGLMVAHTFTFFNFPSIGLRFFFNVLLYYYSRFRIHHSNVSALFTCCWLPTLSAWCKIPWLGEVTWRCFVTSLYLVISELHKCIILFG